MIRAPLVRGLNRGSAAGKEQVISLTQEPALFVEGDMGRLREAIDNLVSNAVKYSPIGGEISISATREDGEAIVRVADQGPGLSPEEDPMSVSINHLQPLVALIAGVLILLMPRILNYVVALYLIIVGIIGLGFVR